MIGTKGPENRFNSVLFIEKEGFNEQIRGARIDEKYDLALMSTKGMPVKAACDLLSSLPPQINIYVLHDFDLYGFIILKTLRQGTRLAGGNNVIDLGLRLDAIEGLPTEPVYYKGSILTMKKKLRQCGCTEEEVDFLACQERVELNAMMADEFVEFVEEKLQAQGIKKVIPDDDVLADTYRRAYHACEVNEKLEELECESKADETDIPEKLKEQVEKRLKKNSSQSWDEVVWNIVNEDYEKIDDDE